jgi:hypothetical protein
VISLIPRNALSAQQIAELRKLSGLSISEIRGAAAAQSSIRDVEIFGHGWHDERLFLSALSKQYANGASAPFTIRETDRSGLNEALSPEKLLARLKFWREIELEQQMHSDLEMGYISSPEGFVPHDSDWTYVSP